MKICKKLIKHLILFLIGGLIYVLVECLWRGYSHWSMFLVGGLCFILIGLVNELFTWEMPLYLQGIIGSIIITSMELIVGYIVNIKLRWNVWDYSDMPFNIAGQICLLFSILWIIISIIAVILDDYLRYWLFNEEQPHYRIL